MYTNAESYPGQPHTEDASGERCRRCLFSCPLCSCPACLGLLLLLSLSGCSYDKQMRAFTDDVCVVPEKFEGWRKKGLEFWCKTGLPITLASPLPSTCMVQYPGSCRCVCTQLFGILLIFWAFLATPRPSSISSLIVIYIRAALGRAACEFATVLCELNNSRQTFWNSEMCCYFLVFSQLF